ncbi:MAG: hypothetical protein IJW25_00010 [Clostridia bacterium]|nr:hypothetical protein [Clostridia bacterium]
MLTLELKEEILKRFTQNYKDLLKKLIYKESNMVRDLFAGDNVKKAFNELVEQYFKSIVQFYKKNPDGTYMEELEYMITDERVKACMENYVSLKGDETIVRFLQVYSYCIQELESVIYDKNYNVKKDRIATFFAQTYNNSIQIFKRLEKDIKEGNYWWLKDSATSLRRVFAEDIFIFNTKRFERMCLKYFGRILDVRVNPENGGLDFIDGKANLLKELDQRMLEYHKAKPYYCWWEIVDEKKKKLHMSETPPPKGVYTYVAYHDRVENRVVEKDNYFL